MAILLIELRAVPSAQADVEIPRPKSQVNSPSAATPGGAPQSHDEYAFRATPADFDASLAQSRPSAPTNAILSE